VAIASTSAVVAPPIAAWVRGRHMTIVLTGDAVPARQSPSGCAAASMARLHGHAGGVTDSEEGDP
jgi:hypothetical protein